MTGSTSNNHHALHPRDDRETLSALFDGELVADAMRFALKRLDHDAAWRNTCGRWQLIGDALRGEATIAAPPEFASGVMRMLAAESQPARMALPDSEAALPAQGISRRRWIGGAALAASVAMVAVLAIRPFSEPSSSGSGAQMAAGVVTPNSALQTGGVVAPISIAPATPTGNSPVPANAVAVSDLPQSTAGVRTTRGGRVIPRPVRSADAPAAGEAATAIASAAPDADHRPFHPPADDIVTRPWPRAVLPDNASAGALAVDFDAGSASPSFYPFEPRLPSQEPASAAQASESPR